jgi:hypothetical protein
MLCGIQVDHTDSQVGPWFVGVCSQNPYISTVCPSVSNGLIAAAPRDASRRISVAVECQATSCQAGVLLCRSVTSMPRHHDALAPNAS